MENNLTYKFHSSPDFKKIEHLHRLTLETKLKLYSNQIEIILETIFKSIAINEISYLMEWAWSK